MTTTSKTKLSARAFDRTIARNPQKLGNLWVRVAGSPQHGYTGIVQHANGRRIYETMVPFAFREAAMLVAAHHATKIQNLY